LVGVADHPEQEKYQGDAQEYLHRDAAHARIVEQRATRRARIRGRNRSHAILISQASTFGQTRLEAARRKAGRERPARSRLPNEIQRTGGAYWMPPFVHSALRPRAMPRYDPAPTFRSKISP